MGIHTLSNGSSSCAVNLLLYTRAVADAVAAGVSMTLSVDSALKRKSLLCGRRKERQRPRSHAIHLLSVVHRDVYVVWEHGRLDERVDLSVCISSHSKNSIQ